MLRTESGKIDGPLQIDGPFTLFGMITGEVTVISGGGLTVNGMLGDSLSVEQGGWAIINGSISGDVINNGGDIQIRGSINGTVIENAGTTIVHPSHASSTVLKPLHEPASPERQGETGPAGGDP